MKEEKNKPHSLKLNRLKAKIWKNTRDEATHYSADIFRTYRIEEGKRANGDDGWRDTHNFSEEDLRVLPLLLEDIAAYIEEDKA